MWCESVNDNQCDTIPSHTTLTAQQACLKETRNHVEMIDMPIILTIELLLSDMFPLHDPHGRRCAERWKWKIMTFWLQVIECCNNILGRVEIIIEKNDVSSWSRWKRGAHSFEKMNWEALYQFLLVKKMMNIIWWEVFEKHVQSTGVKYQPQIPMRITNRNKNKKHLLILL